MLKGKTAIITGGTQGIGKAIVKEFLKCNATVYLIDQKLPEDKESYLKDVNGSPENVLFCQCNITAFDSVSETVQKISQTKSIDILVNNAGITRDSSIKKMTTEQWASVINVNLTGTFNMLRNVIPVMVDNKAGKIVNIASASAHGQFGQANYSASKAGIIGLTKTLALELGKYGITVNCISPGFTITEMTAILPEDVKQKYYNEIPLHRGAKPEEIAYLVRFLSSSESDFITGDEIRIDGGYTI